MREMPKRWRVAVPLLVAALGAGACGRARPRTVPAPPLLVSTAWTDAIRTGPPAVDPAPVGAWLAEAEREEAARAEAARAEAARAAEEAAARARKAETPEPEPPAAVGRLATPETADAAAATRRVRDTVARAQAALATVRADRLKGDARVQYETAKQLIGQAEAAVQAANFMYALRLADKAEMLAKGLAGGDEPLTPTAVTRATPA